MASLGNPRTWIPYMNSKDCSQGFCSPHCPQWCYIVYPPPPPFEYPEDDDSSPSFSPLVIAIIGILATAFLLVSYYAVISKYCGRHRSSRNRNDHELQENHHIHVHEPWHYLLTTGLDEALINSIPVCKYKRGGGAVEVTDCSVCLSEIEDGESVRLLPKCSHAFHLPCIDTWLKSQSTCPLCRAAIFATPQVPAATVMEIPSMDEASPAENESLAVGSGNEEEEEEEEEGSIPGTAAAATSSDALKHGALRAFSDLGNMQGRRRIIEIRDEVYEESIGRSVSMDHHSFQEQQDSSRSIERCSNEAGQSKRCRGESSKFSYKRKVLHCVLSPIAMKRSLSSGRFSLTTSVRGRQGIIPL